MVQIIGSALPIQQTGTTTPSYNVGGLFEALGKPYLDQTSAELKRSTIGLHNATTQKITDAKARLDAALAASGGDPSHPNIAAMYPAILAGDIDAQKGIGGAALANNALLYGAGDKRTQNAQVANGQSYGNTAASDNARNATQRYGFDVAERTKRDIAANTPQTVLAAGPDGGAPVPTIVRQADAYGKPASVGLTEQQGALAARTYPALEAGKPVPDAVQKATGAYVPEDKMMNYVVPSADGGSPVIGRTNDGKTDMATGQPLPQSAQLVSPGNQGGSAAFGAPGGLAQGVKDKLVQARDNHRQVVDLATRIKSMVKSDPSIVGPTGNVIRGLQTVMDTGNGVAKLFGSQQAFQDQFTQAAREMQAKGITMPGLVYDPKASAITKLNTILIYKAASAIAGQAGHDLSDKDVKHVTGLVGDPSSWLEGPNNYLTGLDTAIGESGSALANIDQQLNAGNIRGGAPGALPGAGGAAPAALSAPAAAAPKVMKWGRDDRGNPIPLGAQ